MEQFNLDDIKLSFWDKITIPFYRVKHFLIKIYDETKWKFQRFNRGYADVDVWGLYSWFMTTMEKMLTNLKTTSYSYPYQFKEDKEWYDILDTIVKCLHNMNEDNVVEDKYGSWEDIFCKENKYDYYKNIRQIQLENKEKFFELFSKYFYDLWD